MANILKLLMVEDQIHCTRSIHPHHAAAILRSTKHSKPTVIIQNRVGCYNSTLTMFYKLDSSINLPPYYSPLTSGYNTILFPWSSTTHYRMSFLNKSPHRIIESDEFFKDYHTVQQYCTYPKNISAVKKGEDKKVQVTEQPKDVISL